MKERFNTDLNYIVNAMVKDGGEWSEHSLERSIACLAASLERRQEAEVQGRGERLVSFGYVAAAICLKEIELLPEDGDDPVSLTVCVPTVQLGSVPTTSQ
jgi:hypothetical protein